MSELTHLDAGADWLAHHGIAGQKWGVRNGPPYPIEDKTLAKGTRLSTVQGGLFNWERLEEGLKKNGYFEDVDSTARKLGLKQKWVYTYNDKDKHDKQVYEGAFSYYLMLGRGYSFVNKYELEVMEDLKMPTKKERVDEFVTMYNDKRHMVVKDLVDTQKLLNKAGIGDYKSIDVGRLKTEEDYKKAYEIFNHAMENVGRYKSTQEYANRMSKKYDAMVDDNNQGIYNEAHDPVIIFNQNAVKYVSAKSLDPVSDVKKNLDDLDKYLSSKNKKVML